MSYKQNLPDDEVFLKGRSASKAAQLLRKAEVQGIDPRLVRTTAGGYIVPKALLGDDADTKTADVQEVSNVINENTDEDLSHPDAPEEQDNEFDPADHGVNEVRAYLEDATEEERQRVLDAERNGKARKTLLPDYEGDEN